MSYMIAPQHVIDYPPEQLQEFQTYGLQYIDNRLFALSPEKLLGTQLAMPYIRAAAARFDAMGWEGDGAIKLLWLPSFVFPRSAGIDPVGVVIWHVKQDEDGFSFILSPVQLPFEKFEKMEVTPKIPASASD